MENFKTADFALNVFRLKKSSTFLDRGNSVCLNRSCNVENPVVSGILRTFLFD